MVSNKLLPEALTGRTINEKTTAIVAAITANFTKKTNPFGDIENQ